MEWDLATADVKYQSIYRSGDLPLQSVKTSLATVAAQSTLGSLLSC